MAESIFNVPKQSQFFGGGVPSGVNSFPDIAGTLVGIKDFSSLMAVLAPWQ